MKILFVNKYLFPKGGSETYVMALGKCLESHGNPVQFFGMDHSERCLGNTVNAYSDNMDFHSRGRLNKISYPVRTIYNAKSRKKIRQVLDDFQPDAVHLNNFSYQLTPSIILEIDRWRKENAGSFILHTTITLFARTTCSIMWNSTDAVNPVLADTLPIVQRIDAFTALWREAWWARLRLFSGTDMVFIG